MSILKDVESATDQQLNIVAIRIVFIVCFDFDTFIKQIDRAFVDFAF